MTGNVVADLPPAAPPPRPALTSDLAPPLGRAVAARPGSLRLLGWLWGAGAAAVATGLAAALADGDALRERLTATATAADPAAAPDLVADGVAATIALVTGSVAVLVLVGLGTVALVLRGRSWARWALLAVTLPTLLALDVAQSVVAGGTDVDRSALVAAAVLFVLGPALLLTRSAREHLAPGRRARG
jgi:hypothetical protein